jgi:hypothetical protein
MKRINLCISLIAITMCSYSQSNTYNERKAYLRNEGYTIFEEFYEDLREGNLMFKDRTFYKNGTYIIFAMSEDTDVEDVDLYVYETNGDQYTSDNSVRRMAAVDINLMVSRELRIVVKNFKSRTPNYASRCRFLIAYK